MALNHVEWLRLREAATGEWPYPSRELTFAIIEGDFHPAAGFHWIWDDSVPEASRWTVQVTPWEPPT